MLSPSRIACLAAVLGMLGSGVAALALTESAGAAPGVRRASEGASPGASRGASRGGRAASFGASQALGGAAPSARAPRGASARAGLRLLAEAAEACQDVSYRGEQVITWRAGDDGAMAASVVEVWHRPGEVTVVRAVQPTPAPHVAAAPEDAGQEPGGVLWVSRGLLRLLRANFRVYYAGRGTASGRTAQIVEVRRPGGGLAARFWLDLATKLPLRRVLFGTGTTVVSRAAFIRLRVGERALGLLPGPAVRAWSGQLTSARIAALRSGGWPLPVVLPGHLRLFAASATPARPGEVVELSYSDGLSVVSLFVQRGVLPGALPGWRRVTAAGHLVYATDPSGRSFAWSAGGFVLTLIADAPPGQVSRIVGALPHAIQPGFWGRIRRGFGRLASSMDPFR